jgi:hypothetical protein
MQPILFAAALVGAAFSFAGTAATAELSPRAQAQTYPAWLPPIFRPGYFTSEPEKVRSVRKKSSRAKQVAHKPSATTGSTPDIGAPAAKASIPRFDQALLTPPPEFNCEFKTANVDGGAQTDPGTDAALRMKLDYERQCYQHAEMIMRNRLLELQSSVGEMIKAANGSR